MLASTIVTMSVQCYKELEEEEQQDVAVGFVYSGNSFEGW